MARMLDVIGIVQRYPWGDVEAIPRLLGREPDGSPQAEWWLGTHPSGPSMVSTTTGDDRPLVEVSGPLPYLVKVLAAAMPLSLQVHPDEPTAAAGFAREEALGIDRLADDRTYRDPYAKTEILCALTRFEALCGFRPVADTIAMLRQLEHPGDRRVGAPAGDVRHRSCRAGGAPRSTGRHRRGRGGLPRPSGRARRAHAVDRPPRPRPPGRSCARGRADAPPRRARAGRRGVPDARARCTPTCTVSASR